MKKYFPSIWSPHKRHDCMANDHLIEFHLTEIDIFHLTEIVVIS